MDIFFKILKKSLVATMVVLFAFVATYVPQQNTPTAEAAWSTLPLQISAQVQQTITAIQTTLTAISVLALEIKEFILDGIAWFIAKSIVNTMISNILSWVNSGFNGRPMFVEDLEGFLNEAADKTFNEYINEIGGVGSFLCDPFKLDIQIALDLEFAQTQNQQPTNICTLSGVKKNIDGFIEGTQNSFSKNGGWENWFNLTSEPEVYTPYGALLSAEAELQSRIITAKGVEAKLLDYGSGMLSSKDCNNVISNGVSKEICTVTTPGKIIQEALSFNLDSGRQSLIAADEIDELVANLISQVANKLFTGSVSLLNL